MKVLFLISTVGMGGHTRSAIALGRALRERGVDVHMAAGNGKGIEIVEKSGLPFTVLPTVKGRKNFMIDGRTRSAFEVLAAKEEPAVIHAFDLHAMTTGYHYARRRGTKLVYTICGGPVPQIRIPAMRPIVVFSNELHRGLQAKHGIAPDRLFVNAARFRLLQEVFPDHRLETFRRKVGLPEKVPVVMTICRVARSKLPLLFHFVEVAERMGGASEAVFLIVGSSDDPVSLERLREAIARVNARHRKRTPVVYWTDQESTHAARLLPLATAAIGIGRTVFEPMSLGIPALVVGNHGFAGVADAAACDQLAETNFSGRDALCRPPGERAPEATATVLQRLLAEPAYRQQVAEEGRRWVQENLDVARGADFYAALYRRHRDDFYSLPAPWEIFRLECRSAFFRFYEWITPERLKRQITDVRRGKVNLAITDG